MISRNWASWSLLIRGRDRHHQASACGVRRTVAPGRCSGSYLASRRRSRPTGSRSSTLRAAALRWVHRRPCPCTGSRQSWDVDVATGFLSGSWVSSSSSQGTVHCIERLGLRSRLDDAEHCTNTARPGGRARSGVVGRTGGRRRFSRATPAVIIRPLRSDPATQRRSACRPAPGR